MDFISNKWIRIPFDIMAYDENKEPEKLQKTYGVKLLSICGDGFIKVFSPDLNKNVLINENELERM